MEERTTREIDRIRLRLIDLVKSFFVEEPDAERLSRWRGIFTALAHEQVNGGIDSAVREIRTLLDSCSLKEIQQEFYELLENPFSKDLINLSASFYADGRSHGQTLADFRGFLNEAGLIRHKDVTDAEDTLPVMLDCLASLIELEKEDVETTEQQAVLVNTYLAPLTINLVSALEKNTKAKFYGACGRFAAGYVELEKGLFEFA